MVNDTDRGQLLLIAGLLVATTIIGSVVLLNSIHADASVGAQQDAQSLENADRAAGEIATDLDRLFMQTNATNEAGEPLPYARNDDFNKTIVTYNEAYRNLTANTSARLVNISSKSHETGAIVRQDGAQELPTGDDIITDAQELPRVSINVSEPADELQLKFGGDDYVLFLNETDVSFNGDDHGWDDCGGLDSSGYAVEFYNGVGEIRDSHGTVCSNKQLQIPSDFDVEFENDNGAEGNFTITATEGEVGNVGDFDANDPGEGYQWGVDDPDDIIVNPVFELTYDDPSVGYSSIVQLYEGAYYED